MVEKMEELKVKDDTDFVNFGKRYFQNGNSVDYQIKPIKKPLLKVDKKLEKMAVEVFVHISRWCGITAIVGKSSLSTLQTAAKIITPGLREVQMRDET